MSRRAEIITKTERLLREGRIGERDAAEIRSFSAFLAAVRTWPVGAEGVRVPAEWWPYLDGTGPAPRRARERGEP